MSGLLRHLSDACLLLSVLQRLLKAVKVVQHTGIQSAECLPVFLAAGSSDPSVDNRNHGSDKHIEEKCQHSENGMYPS